MCLCVCVYIFSCHMNTNAKVLFKQWITCLLVSTCIRESMCTCTHRADAIVKGLPGQSCWSIHGLSVIIGSPAGTIDVDVLWVQAKRSGLHHVRYISIQHSHTWCINTEIKHAFDQVRSISQESKEEEEEEGGRRRRKKKKKEEERRKKKEERRKKEEEEEEDKKFVKPL